MTKKQREKHISNLINIVRDNNFTVDRWGNYVRKHGENVFRIKFMKNNLRFEVKKDAPKMTWFNIMSKPFIRIDVDEFNGKLKNRLS